MSASATATRTVRAAVAPLLVEPRISTPLTSQLVAGELVQVIESRGDWLRIRGEDAYDGWTHAGYLAASSGAEHTWPLSLGCVVRDATGTTRALPLGARIAPDQTVISGSSISAEERASRFPATRHAIAASAETLFAGASYLWGGVTPWGCDCSGFVQRIFRLHGVALPRDAWQQALEGDATAADATAAGATSAHLPADLLFFSDRDDRRVTHVGMALGDGRMIHSALRRGCIAVERLDSGDSYVAKLRHGCVGVRRVVS